MEIDIAEIPLQAGFTSKDLEPTTSLYYGVYPPAGRSARYYDSWSGTWMSVDPLAKKYPAWSPYNYVEDNPTGLTDPNGKGWFETNTSNVPHFDPNINSQAELNKNVVGYTYLGETAFTVDKQGNSTFYNANGRSGPGVFMAPMQIVTANGKPTSTLEKMSLITTSAGFSAEAGKTLLGDLANAQDFLYQSDAIRGIVGSAEHFATFAGILNAGIALRTLVKQPTTRNLVNFGLEGLGAVPDFSLGVTFLDVTGLKHDLLQRIPNEKLF